MCYHIDAISYFDFYMTINIFTTNNKNIFLVICTGGALCESAFHRIIYLRKFIVFYTSKMCASFHI